MPEPWCGKYKPGGPGCRLPEGHEGRCNPRPDIDSSEIERRISRNALSDWTIDASRLAITDLLMAKHDELAALRAERDRERNLRHDIHAERCALLAEVERITTELAGVHEDLYAEGKERNKLAVEVERIAAERNAMRDVVEAAEHAEDVVEWLDDDSARTEDFEEAWQAVKDTVRAFRVATSEPETIPKAATCRMPEDECIGGPICQGCEDAVATSEQEASTCACGDVLTPNRPECPDCKDRDEQEATDHG